MTSSKILGQGRQTKRQGIEEALKLERNGRGDETTREILYDETEVRDWYQDHPETRPSQESTAENCNSDSDETDHTSSDHPISANTGGFIDNRPSKFGGSGFGFGFGNAKVVNKRASKKRYNWKQKVEQEERRRRKLDDDQDFESDESESEEHSSTAESEPDESESNSNADSHSDDESSESDGEERSDSEIAQCRNVSSSVAQEFKEWANQEIKKLA